MAGNSPWVAACQEGAKPKIQEWLRIARMAAMDSSRITLEGHLAELARLRETALSLGQAAAGVQAEVHRGKASGLYEDHVRITTGMSDAELLNALKGYLGEELTAKLATQLGCISETKTLDQS
jgi:hypothetical protein